MNIYNFKLLHLNQFSLKKIIFIIYISMLIAGCGSVRNSVNINDTCDNQVMDGSKGSLSIFLNIPRQSSFPDLKIVIDSVELLVGEVWIPVMNYRLEVFTSNTLAVQRFVARDSFDGQVLSGVRIRVADAYVNNNKEYQPINVINHEVTVALHTPSLMESGARHTLMLEWDPQSSISGRGFEGMVVKANISGFSRVTANLAYVSCPDIDTVYVVGTDLKQVIDAFTVSGGPTYLAADAENMKIYVLAAKESKIKQYDIATHLLGKEIKIPLLNEPSYIAFNFSTQSAYVLDRYGVLTRIDLRSGNMLTNNRICNKPSYIHYINGYDKLAISSVIDQTVYLVNPLTLAVEGSISVTSPPDGLASLDNYLYISETLSNQISVYSLAERLLLKTIHVGSSPTRFTISNDEIYVSNQLDGSISIIQAHQFNVNKDMMIGTNPREMAVSESHRLLIVGEELCAGALVVVDTTGNQVIGRVELGAKPMGIAVMD